MTNTTKPALSAAPVGEPLRRIVLDTLNAVAPAVENLSVHQEQCDRDGVMVKVSRQALDEVLNAVNEVAMQSAITTSPASPVAQEPMTAFSDETGRDWLPLKYEDGPDFCTVTLATGAAFALTVHPERMKLMEAALSASPVAQEPVAIKPLEWTSEPPYWVARVFGGFYSIERHEHGTELQGTFIRHLRCASVEAAKSAAQFDYEKRIRGALTIPPATPAGLGADEIARVFARWKNSKNLHESLAAQNIEKELLALLSRAGDQSNSTQKDGSR